MFFLLRVLFVIQSIYSLQAQNTSGTEFWLTFGRIQTLPPNSTFLEMSIRIVNGNLPSTVTIYFTNLNSSEQFYLNAYEVYTYSLNVTQREAVGNTTTGITDYSIHITSSESVMIYAHIGSTGNGSSDATNVLPVTALKTEYYAISYLESFPITLNIIDAYAVVATQNETSLYHNGDLVDILNAGQVYYRTSVDMTGAHITSNNPIAFFALHQGTQIPSGTQTLSNLFQQLSPISTWGKTFFVPVTIMESEIVRIVASQNNTNITQLVGGAIRTGIPGAQTSFPLQAGEFVELDIFSIGCFIQTDKPIEICAYLKYQSIPYPAEKTNTSQVWIPGIEQTVSSAIVSPFYLIIIILYIMP